MVLDIFDRIGVLEAAKSGKFTLGLFHVVGPRSLRSRNP
jgi:hypothetical protein